MWRRSPSAAGSALAIRVGWSSTLASLARRAVSDHRRQAACRPICRAATYRGHFCAPHTPQSLPLRR